MSYSTEDCKKYLITIYKDTEEKGWKRVKKYNDEEKRVARDFEYKDGRKATILETSEGLKDKSLLAKPQINNANNPFAQIRQQNSQNHTQKKIPDNKKDETEKFKDFMTKILNGENPNVSNTPGKSSIDKMKDFLKEQEEANNRPQNDFFGFGGMPDIYSKAIMDHLEDQGSLEQLVKVEENFVTKLLKDIHFLDLDTNEEKFLYVLVNGTQWQEEEDNKASTDFYPNIVDKENFFKNLQEKNVDLPNMYLTHVINIANMIESMDEGYIPFHVMEGEEALKTMCETLKEISEIYESNGSKVEFNKDLTEGILYTAQRLKDLCSMNDAEDLWEREDIENELDELMNFIKSKSPKKGMKP